MQVLCFHLQREHIGEHKIEGGGDLLYGRRLQIGRGVKRGKTRSSRVFGSRHVNLLRIVFGTDHLSMAAFTPDGLLAIADIC
jgi:hypothetical protein